MRALWSLRNIIFCGDFNDRCIPFNVHCEMLKQAAFLLLSILDVDFSPIWCNVFDIHEFLAVGPCDNFTFSCRVCIYFYTVSLPSNGLDPLMLLSTRDRRNIQVKLFYQLATLNLSCMSYADCD